MLSYGQRIDVNAKAVYRILKLEGRFIYQRP